MTPDEAPFASFTSTPAPVNSATSFDASSSYSLTGGGLTYSWNFGDGSVSPPPSSSNSYNQTTTHVYAMPGTYTVTLTVTDAAGTSTSVVYTGQYVSRNGGPSAEATGTVSIPGATSNEPPIAYVADGTGNQVTPILAIPGQADSPDVAGAPITVGTHPSAIAITPDGTTAYVTNYGSDNVTEIDTSTNAAAPSASWIPVGSEPNAIAISPDGTTAYVANAGDGTITKIALATNTVQGQPIKVGGDPTGIAISPNGTVAYVTNNNAGYENLIPITLANDTIEPGIPVGTQVGGEPNATDPVAVAITPDGTTALVVDRGSSVVPGAVTPVNLATDEAGTPFSQIGGSGPSIGNDPDAIAISPNGQDAYVTNFASGTLSEITLTSDVASAIETSSAGSDPLGVAVTPDGSGAYVADGLATPNGSFTPTGTVSVLPVPSAAATPISINVGSGPDAVAITPDQAPVATLTVEPGVAGNPTNFDASQSVVPSSSVAEYIWNFEDGSSLVSTTTPTTSYTYSVGGSYDATVTVVDQDEADAVATSTPPTPDATLITAATTQVFTGQTVSLNGSTSAQASQTVNVPYALPTVSSVTPTTGETGSATSVIVSGTNFDGVTGVDLGSLALTLGTGYVVTSSTSISITVPPTLAAGSVDITVTNPAGTSLITPNDVFTNLPTTSPVAGAPTITSMSVNFGPVAGGTGVTITGTNFAGTTAVDFSSVAATQYVVSADGTSVTVISPPTSNAGTVDVTITNSTGTSQVTQADAFTYVAPPAVPATPTVTSVASDFGPTTGLTQVTITGTNLTGTTAVDFGSVPAQSFHDVNATTLTAVTAPVASAQTVDVTVQTPLGTSPVVPADTFTFESGTLSAGPVVSSVTPNSGPVAGGNSVVITGTNFDSVSVNFGSQPASSFSVNNLGTEIIATAPSVGAPQSVDVVVTNSLGASTITPADAYTYQPSAQFAPTVTAVSPSSGPLTGGGTVTVTGTGFTQATDVFFGTIDVDSFFIANNGDTITVTAPDAGVAGTVSVTVVNPYGTSAVSAADAYTFLPANPPTTGPQVTSVVPDTGVTSGETGVVISGTGFTSATAVDFGGDAAPDFTVNAAGTEITAVTPGATSPASVDVTVTAGGDTSPITVSDVFTYVATSLPQPVVTSLSPSTGPATGGTVVSIVGSNLGGALGVDFGGVPGTSVSVNSAGTQITVTSPPSTVVGAVAVIVATEGGLSASSSSTVFTYGEPPSTYTAIVPYRALDTRQPGQGGPLGPGVTRTLAIGGVGAVPMNASAVIVNVTSAKPTAASSLTIFPTGLTQPATSSMIMAKGQNVAHLVEVPLGAGGAISIANANGTTQVVVDVEGYFTGGTGNAGRFVPVSPVSAFDTGAKGGSGPLGQGHTLVVKLGHIKGLPTTGVSAVIMRLTSYDTTSSSWVAQYPLGAARPNSSVLNPTPGVVATNLVEAKLGTNNSIVLYNYFGKTNLSAVVVGYITGASSAAVGAVNTPMDPTVLFNSAAVGSGGALGTKATRSVNVVGVGQIPSDVTKVLVNVTVTGTSKSSSLTLYAGGASRPSVPNLVWTKGQSVSQLVIVPVGANGSINLYNLVGTANVTVTAEGFYTA